MCPPRFEDRLPFDDNLMRPPGGMAAAAISPCGGARHEVLDAGEMLYLSRP
jgi:hypothetical protein